MPDSSRIPESTPEQILEEVDHIIEVVKRIGLEAFEVSLAENLGLILKYMITVLGLDMVLGILDQIIIEMKKNRDTYETANDMFEMNLSVLRDIHRLNSES